MDWLQQQCCDLQAITNHVVAVGPSLRLFTNRGAVQLSAISPKCRFIYRHYYSHRNAHSTG
jgi:hypothetical protein